jgi:hypothetical protein
MLKLKLPIFAFAFLLLCSAAAAQSGPYALRGPIVPAAQSTTTPVDPVLDAWAAYQAGATPLAGNLIVAVINWKAAREAAETDHTNRLVSLEGAVNGSGATPTSMQAQINALALRVQTLEKAAAPSPTPPSTSTVDFSQCPAGALNGTFQGVAFGSGVWQCTGTALQPVADSQVRTLVFPRPVIITALTFATVNARTTGITLTGDGKKLPVFLQSLVNTATTIAPAFAAPITTLQISGDGGATSLAPDLRIFLVTYK